MSDGIYWRASYGGQKRGPCQSLSDVELEAIVAGVDQVDLGVREPIDLATFIDEASVETMAHAILFELDRQVSRHYDGEINWCQYRGNPEVSKHLLGAALKQWASLNVTSILTDVRWYEFGHNVRRG